MNKVYRIVYNHATQTWTAVQEHAKGHGKYSTVNKSAAVTSVGGFVRFAYTLIMSGILFVINGQSMAAEIESGTGPNSIIVFPDASTKGTAIGQSAVSIGNASKADGREATAIGTQAQATEQSAVAIGTNSNATGVNSLAFGNNKVTASGDNSLALGHAAQATKQAAFAAGDGANAAGVRSMALGNNSSAATMESIAIGASAKAQAGNNALAVGRNSLAGSEGAAAYGTNTKATGWLSVAVGYEAEASASEALAMGRNAKASGSQAVAIGKSTQGSGVGSVAIGEGAQTANQYSVAIGKDSKATQPRTVAIGWEAKGIGNYATAIGEKSEATHTSATALGTGAKAIQDSATALGVNSTASGNSANAIGWSTVASGQNTNAMGRQAMASGASSTAIGTSAKSIGAQSIAIGTLADATAAFSTVIGPSAAVTGADGTALGRNATTSVANGVALGSYSVANVASGAVGADPLSAATNKTTSAWKSTHGAVSVGNGTTATRQITSVAAGTQDTDAVNVAQLKAAGFKLNATNAGGGESTSIADDKIQNGETLTVDAGKNIKVTHTANTVSIATKDEVTFNKTTVGNVVTDGTTNKITGLANGTAAGDAVNFSQLDAVKNTAESPLTFAGDTGNNFERKLGTTVNIKGGKTADLTDNNIGVEADGADTLTIKLAKDVNLGATGSLTTGITKVDNTGVVITPAAGGNPVKLTPTGLDNGSNKIINVANGTNPNDAVNFSQLEAVKNAANAAKTEVKSANQTVKITESKNGDATVYDLAVNTGTGLEVATDGKINVKTDGTTITTDANGAIKANTTPLTTGTDGKAQAGDTTSLVTGDQVAQAINNSGLSFSGDVAQNADNKFTRTNQQETKIIGGVTDKSKLTDNNIGVVSNGTDTLTVKLAKDLSGIGSAQFVNNAGASTIKIDGDAQAITGLKTTIADPAAATNVTKPAVTTTNAATLGDVLNVGWNIQGNGTGVDFVQPYDTVNFVDGNATTAKVTTNDNKTTTISYDVNVDNATIKVDGNGKLYADVKNTSLTDGDTTTVTNTGTPDAPVYKIEVKKASVNTTPTDTAHADDITITTKGKVTAPTTNAGNKFVTAQNLADVVNNTGFTLKTSGNVDASSGDEIINPADTVEMIAGKNLTVKQEPNGKITYATKDKVEFNEVKVGGVTIDGATNKITGLAAGTAPNDAVNFSQLKQLQDSQKTTTVVAGKNVTVDSKVVNNNTEYTVNAEKTTLSGGTTVTATPTTNAATGVTDYVLDLSQATKDDITKGVDAKNIVDTKGLTFTGDSGTTGVKKLGDTVAVTGDANITTKADTNGVQVTLNKDLTGLDSVTTNTLTAGTGANQVVLDNAGVNVGGNTYISNAGLNANGKTIANVADGVKSNDAVNVSQLEAVKAIANKAANTKVEGDQGVTVTSAPNTDGGTTYTVAAKTDGTTIKVDGSGNLTANTTPLTTGTDGKVTIPANAGALATAGDIAKAINNSGFFATASGNVVGAATNHLIKTGDTATFDAGNNLEVTQTNGKFSFATKKDVTFNNVTVGPVVINQGTGINAGNKTITGVADGVNPADAVNVRQLNTKVANMGLSFSGDSGNKFTRTNQQETKVLGGATGTLTDNNIGVVSDGTDTLTVKLAKDVDLGANGSVKAGNTTVDNKGVTIAPTAGGSPVTLTGSGLHNGGNRITGVAAGIVDTDAVNFGQLKDYQAANDRTTTVAAGSSAVSVYGSTVGTNTHYVIDISDDAKQSLAKADTAVQDVVSANPNLKAVKAGDTIVVDFSQDPNFNSVNINNGPSMSAHGINAGDKPIANVADGVNPTDAVNVGQLDRLGRHLNNRIGDVEDEANAGVSSAMAMASLPQAYIPGKSMLTGGISTYNGQGAVAVGLSKLSDNGRWVLKISGSADTKGNAGGAVGAGFHF